MLLWRAGLQSKWPRLEVIYADGGYTGPNVSAAGEQLGCRIEIVSAAAGTKGFKVLPKRWVVERPFGYQCLQLGRSNGFIIISFLQTPAKSQLRYEVKLSPIQPPA